MPNTCTVTGTLKDVEAAALVNAFVRFRLTNFAGFVPRIQGSTVIVEPEVDVPADNTGSISATLYRNDIITPANTYYVVEFWNAGRITETGRYIFASATADLDSISPVATPPPPQGFKLVLENNGVLNSSQDTLNLTSQDSSITIVDNGSGAIDLHASGGVTSVFGRTGAVTAQSGDYAVAQVTGAAPLASPALTGAPTAPTPATGDNSTKVATTAFVKAQGYLTAAPVASVFGRTGAVSAQSGDYTASQVTNAQDNSVSQAQHTVLAAPSGSSGTPSFRQVTDADLSLSDITTNNVSTSAHGFVPKLPNDATKFLDGTGAFSTPSGGSSGSLVLLEKHTASNSAELDFTTRNATGQSGATIQSDYDEYLIEINQLVPATNLVNIVFQFSTNGGSSYDTGSNYAWVGHRESLAGTAANAGSNATTSFGMDVSGQVSSTASRGGLVASVRLYLSANGTVRPKLMWNACNDDGTSNIAVWCTAAGTYLSTTAVNAFRILCSSGNLSSGTVRIYGIAK